MSDQSNLESYRSALQSTQIAEQLQAVNLLKNSDEGIDALFVFCTDRQKTGTPVDVTDGKIYQTLWAMAVPTIVQRLVSLYPQGLVPIGSANNVNYAPLQDLLARQEYQKADALTTQKLCEAAGEAALQRGWLYFTEIDRIPTVDLQTIDRLWVIYSEGKFGFSVQRKLWLNLGKNWEKLWQQILWKKEGSFTRYPDEFIWSLEAPKGHLPLSNQIRGNKTLEAIFLHRSWS